MHFLQNQFKTKSTNLTKIYLSNKRTGNIAHLVITKYKKRRVNYSPDFSVPIYTIYIYTPDP